MFFALHSLAYFAILFTTSFADFSTTYCGSNGWTIWKGNCYKLFAAPESMTFPVAENFCRQLGSHAASVHSDAENDLLASMATEAFNLLETNVPVLNGQPLHWDRIHGGIWNGYRRQPTPNSDKFHCSWSDGTPMDYASAPEPDSVRQQTKTQAHWMGYPWEGPNPDNADHSIAVCGNKECPGDSDQCVEMIKWPGSRLGTWNDLSCLKHKLSGVFCKKPVNCVNE